MARDEQVLRLVVVIISHRQRHGALLRRDDTVGEPRHALEPTPRSHIGEADRRRDAPRVLSGHGQVGVEPQHRIADDCTGCGTRTAQSLETDLVARGDLHGAVEEPGLSRRFGRAARARQKEGALEEACGLARQLRQLPLQRLELAGGVTGRSPREQEVHELESNDDIRGSAGHHLSQEVFPALPLPGVGGPRGELCQGIQRADVGGIAPQHAVDFAARVGLPTGLPVHARQHQSDVTVGGIERRGAAQLDFGVAGATFPQVYEPEVRIPEGLIGGERHDLLELRFGTGELILLQVRQSPGSGRESRVAPRLVSTRGRSPTRHCQQQS